MSQMRDRLSIYFVALSLMLSMTPLKAQIVQKDASSPRLTETTVRKLLREPNGLEACARLASEFIMRDDLSLIAREDLHTLARDSSLIVLGQIKGVSSFLADDGDDIFTHFTISSESVFKGQVEGAFTLLTRGGKVGFPDGSSAQILTIETDSIKVNGQYLFFLVPVNAARKEFRSTNGVEGIILLSMAENSVRSLAGNTADANLHPIIGELRGLSVSSLLGKVRSTIAAGAADGR